MGYYVEVPAHHNKAELLKSLHGAQDANPSWPPPEGRVLVCVVDNGWMEAAGICYDASEFEAFNDAGDPRPKRWVSLDRSTALALNPSVADVLA